MNWVAIVSAALAYWLLGAVWYTVFGRAWQRLIGKTRAELGAPTPKFVLSFAASLVGATVIAWLSLSLGASTLAEGARLGALGWLGFAATSAAFDHLFADRGLVLYLLNQGYQLSGFVLMGCIVTLWR